MNTTTSGLSSLEPWRQYNPSSKPVRLRSSPFEKGLEQLGISLNDRQLDAFEKYHRELTDWNQRFNLTRIVECSQVQTLHFLDSLTAWLVLSRPVNEGGRIMDLGSGAGFPGLPLKIAFPEIRLTLVESVGKKVSFLQHLLRALELPDVGVLHGRAEALAHEPAHRAAFDTVLARGLASLRVLAELALPFCRQGGVVVAYKKGDLSEELAQAQNAITLMGGRIVKQQAVDVEGLRDRRVLVVIRKVADTPAKYPRRPGMPKKRPL